MNSTSIGERFVARCACITCLALSVSTFTASAAAAPTFPEAPQMTVFYGDLELTRTAGIAKLYRRIARAAAQVCEGTNSKLSQNAARARSCTAHAIAESVARVGSPGLSKYHVSRTRQIETVQTAAAVQP